MGQKGTRAVIVCPIGFVADHIEVVWDLDYELRLQAEQAGIAFARASTPNADRRFARLAAGLIDELRTGAEPLRVAGPDPVARLRIQRQRCAVLTALLWHAVLGTRTT